MLAADNRQAPMTLRVNRRRGSVQACQAMLQQAGIAARPVGAAGLELERALPVTAIPGFADGWLSVQDAAAQLAAPLLLDGLSAGSGLKVLDACAAPGGKTAHLLELADCEVTALDIDEARCGRIRQNLQRLGLSARVIAADAAAPDTWWPAAGATNFDAILLDAPCTASGIVRRHPDIPWLRREADIAQLATVQAGLLRALWPLLKAGGRLLYATCSVFHEEGVDQVESFVANNSDVVLRHAPGHLLPQSTAPEDSVRDNPLGEHDGFFYALLEKLPPPAGPADPVRRRVGLDGEPGASPAGGAGGGAVPAGPR
jgi:16S rRNA (cytosine967-C5)-methyltransferase